MKTAAVGRMDAGQSPAARPMVTAGYSRSRAMTPITGVANYLNARWTGPVLSHRVKRGPQ